MLLSIPPNWMHYNDFLSRALKWNVLHFTFDRIRYNLSSITIRFRLRKPHRSYNLSKTRRFSHDHRNSSIIAHSARGSKHVLHQSKVHSYPSSVNGTVSMAGMHAIVSSPPPSHPRGAYDAHVQHNKDDGGEEKNSFEPPARHGWCFLSTTRRHLGGQHCFGCVSSLPDTTVLTWLQPILWVEVRIALICVFKSFYFYELLLGLHIWYCCELWNLKLNHFYASERFENF